MAVANVTIVGVGPRGISVLERLGAASPEQPIVLHLVDSSELGSGAIWETQQTRTLCMNTLAGAVTLFTEPGSSVGLPVFPGPTMFEWIQAIRGDDDAPEYQMYQTYPANAQAEVFSEGLAELISSFADEIAVTRTESNPSRALYGAYLRWCFDVALHRLPQNVTVEKHQARAVSLTEIEADGLKLDKITLSDGSTIFSHATVLALGWVTPSDTSHEALLAQSSLPWVRPANPVEQDLSAIPSAQSQKLTLVRGLGMGFFDVMALVTIGRGGSFIEDASARSGLRYEPSGQEPLMVIGSGRGYPFLPKSEYGDLPPVAPTPAFDRVFDELSQHSEPISFQDQVYPAILADAQAEDPTFDVDYWFNPLANFSGDISELTDYLGQRLTEDIQQAKLAQASPLKNALWVISSVRKRVSILGAGGRYTDTADVSQFMRMGQMVGSGPPLFRSRQLLALLDAGLIRFIGAAPSVEATDAGWKMVSPTTGEPVVGEVLVDAWMHNPNTFSTLDPLLVSLRERMRPFAGTGSPETDPVSRALVHPDGSQDPRLLLIGIPTAGQHPDTTISPMPGTDPLFLQETDKAAQSLLKMVASV
ncbi:MAG: FAD/NAD(P)-binding protein [Rothia sp. (in: high G+C Gram-positive bacteria)]|nr:FAD/NAD(P)-binding protein [Rothia sp. (in: high G+C Gram-positive bacteria)]